MPYQKREISATPAQLHLKELYGEFYPLTLAPNPEMKAASYAGETFGRCSIIFRVLCSAYRPLSQCHVMNTCSIVQVPTCSLVQVPISSKFLFSHVILYFMQLTSTNFFLIWIK